MDAEQLLDEFDIIPDKLKNQFFLTDEEIIKKIVSFANLEKTDTVLEIGAGIGNLTSELAKKAGNVITFEIDEQFQPILSKLPKNVDIYYEDAWKYIQLRGKTRKRKSWNKIVTNPPYKLLEPLLHNLTFLDYDKVILLVPIKFAQSAKRSPVFSSFFEVEEKLIVDKRKFYPVPRTHSVVIELHKLPNPIEQKNLSLYLRQYLYQHEGQKARNALTEGIIQFTQAVYRKRITKNEAREIIKKSGIDRELLESEPKNPEIYEQVSMKMGKVNLS